MTTRMNTHLTLYYLITLLDLIVGIFVGNYYLKS